MKNFVVVIFLTVFVFKLKGQTDFLMQAQHRICTQIQADDIKILEVADSLYTHFPLIDDPKTKAYLNYWKALGFYHSFEQPLDSIVTYATAAQKTFLEINDSDGLFETYSLMSKTLFLLSDWTHADRYLKKGKQLANTPFKEFQSLLNEALKYINLDKIDSTFVKLYEAEKKLATLPNENCWYDYYKAELNINLGMAEIRRADYENTNYPLSIKYFKRAINAYGYSEEKGIENYLFCLINLSYCYRKSGFFGVQSVSIDSGRVYLEKYIDIVEKLPVNNKYGKLESAYVNLGWQLFSEGKADVGIYHVNRSRVYLDSMYMDLMDKKALEITNSFENQLKDQEIVNLNSSNAKTKKNLVLLGSILLITAVLLMSLIIVFIRSRKKNKILEQQQQEILSIKNQLELLLREIHHRIKNNLQIISSFLGIQKRVLSEPQASLALAQSQSRIQTISYLHEQLYEQKGLEKVAVAPYFEKLISYIKDNIPATYEVSITNKVENHILEFDLCLSMGIVLNELVTNALKHAFTKAAGNTIEVVFKKTTQHYLLEVSDNGKGFSKQKLQQTAGLGHEIIDAIVKKINAELEISEKFGTTIFLKIPM